MNNTNNQFRIDLFEGWEDQSLYSFMTTSEDDVSHVLNLVVDNFVGDSDLHDFAQDRINAVKDALPSIETLKEEERVLPSGIPVYEWVYKFATTDSEVTFKKHVYLLAAGKGYSFSASFSKQSLKTIGTEVDRMIESFAPLQ